MSNPMQRPPAGAVPLRERPASPHGGKPISAVESVAPVAVDTREERLFQALDIDRDHHVRRRELDEMLRLAGLSIEDSRLRAVVDHVRKWLWPNVSKLPD